MNTDTSERGLERLICTALTGHACDPARPDWVGKPPTAYGGLGWVGGAPEDYDREYCVDLAQLSAFLRETQPEAAEALALAEDGPIRRKFLARLQGEIAKRGTIDVLRRGIKHGPHHISTSSTARRPPATPRPRNRTGPTASASRGSSATVATRPSSPWTSASSSTACRSSPSS
jgi:type I restriction enzyme, R subunit